MRLAPTRLSRTTEERRRNYQELVMQAVDPEKTMPSAGTFNINASAIPTASALRSNGNREENSAREEQPPQKTIIETNDLLENRL